MNDTPIEEEPNQIDAINDEAEAQQKEKLSVDEEINEAVQNSKLAEKKKKARKKQFKLGGAGLAVLLVGYVIYWGMQPFSGTMLYGICKVFLELDMQYPHTLRVSTVEEMGASVRIWYTQTDGYGEYRMEPIRCYFKKDEKLGLILDKVTIRRRPIDQEIVNDFNRSIPSILENPPDLTLPARLPDSLNGLQFETDKFRRRLF